MSSSEKQPLDNTHMLKEAVNQLKDCQPLVNRLKAKGVTIQLGSKEIASLLNFEKMVLANYTDSQWSYLRVASGVQLSGIAVLSTCLTRYQASLLQQAEPDL